MAISQRVSRALIRGAALTIALAFATVGTASPRSANERAAVVAANAQFYAALNQMFKGELGAMKAVWSHADDVTYMGPTENFERGWAAVLKDWEGQAALKLGGRVQPADIQIILGRDVAVVSDYENGEKHKRARQGRAGEAQSENIFRKEGRRWKMVGHQHRPAPLSRQVVMAVRSQSIARKSPERSRLARL